MQIADNVLRHHLRNVLWLCGGACGGKSTMAGILAEKFDLMLYDCDNRWIDHQKLATKDEQPTMIRSGINWEQFFLQPVDDLVKWSHQGITDQMSMVIVDLIQMSQKKRVIVDGIFHPMDIKRIAPDNQIAYLFAEPDLIRKVYFDRDHTHSMLAAINAASEPEKVLKNVLNSIVTSSNEELNWAKDYELAYFVRNSSTQSKDIQVFLEQHFQL